MNKRLSKIIITIALVAFLATGGIFLYKTAYENGKTAGRKNYETETASLVQDLATAVSEKTSDLASLDKLNELPSEIDSESISAYLDVLSKIELQNSEAKEILKSYETAWQSMKTTYASEDNEKIAAEFEVLKTTASETAQKLQTLYDDHIRSALEKL